jgi:hypothetical protein
VNEWTDKGQKARTGDLAYASTAPKKKASTRVEALKGKKIKIR